MGEAEVEYLPVEDLREAEDNPRLIRDERFEHLCRTVARRPGLLEARPLILDDERGDIVAGNMRLRAAKELIAQGNVEFAEWVEQRGGLPVFRHRFEDASERREWLALDNHGFGEWVPEGLAAMMQAHADEGGDLAMLGFAQPEVDALLALAKAPPAGGGLPDADPDETPEPPVAPVTQDGDLWLLGDHRLVCGNAHSLEALALLLDVPTDEPLDRHRVVDCVWTDPPYGVNYNPEGRVLADGRWTSGAAFSAERAARPLGRVEGDEHREGEAYATWLAGILQRATMALRDGGGVYLMHAAAMSEWTYRAWREADLYFASQLIWRKSRIVFGRGDYHWAHEPVIYGWKPGAAHRWHGDATQSTVFEVAADFYGNRAEHGLHGNQKPYDLIRPMLENSTEPGEVVLDPFGGSGSTLIVCEQLGRACRMMELDPRFVDVIVRRWQTFTGREAERITA